MIRDTLAGRMQRPRTPGEEVNPPSTGISPSHGHPHNTEGLEAGGRSTSTEGDVGSRLGRRGRDHSARTSVTPCSLGCCGMEPTRSAHPGACGTGQIGTNDSHWWSNRNGPHACRGHTSMRRGACTGGDRCVTQCSGPPPARLEVFHETERLAAGNTQSRVWSEASPAHRALSRSGEP